MSRKRTKKEIVKNRYEHRLRYHFIFYDLGSEFFRRGFVASYNFFYHNYTFTRYYLDSAVVRDFFVVIRKSPRKFVIVYVYPDEQIYGYFGARSTREAAKYMRFVAGLTKEALSAQGFFGAPDGNIKYIKFFVRQKKCLLKTKTKSF